MKNAVKLLLCCLLSLGSFGVCCILSMELAPKKRNEVRVENPNTSPLFLNRPESLLLSNSIKSLIIKTSNMSLALFNAGQYEKAAACLLSSEAPIEEELKRLGSLQGANSNELGQAKALLRLYLSEDIAHAGECFLRARQYREAQSQFEKCIPYLRTNALDKKWDHPIIHEVYKNYIKTLEKLNETKKVAVVRNEYQLVIRATTLAKHTRP